MSNISKRRDSMGPSHLWQCLLKVTTQSVLAQSLLYLFGLVPHNQGLQKLNSLLRKVVIITPVCLVHMIVNLPSLLILTFILTLLPIIAPQNSVQIWEILFYDQIHETASANIMINASSATQNSTDIWTVINPFPRKENYTYTNSFNATKKQRRQVLSIQICMHC